MSDSFQSRPRRVAKGARLLDEKVPGWAEKIATERLNIAHVCNCVLGQVFDTGRYGGGFSLGIDALDINDPNKMVDCGFDGRHILDDEVDEDKEYAALNRYWLREIEKRLVKS